MPLLMSGSADLYGSTMNYIDGGGDFNRDNPGGRTSDSAFANMGCVQS